MTTVLVMRVNVRATTTLCVWRVYMMRAMPIHVLCARAGGRRLFGFSAEESNPNLRGVSNWRGVAQLLPAAEVSTAQIPSTLVRKRSIPIP